MNHAKRRLAVALLCGTSILLVSFLFIHEQDSSVSRAMATAEEGAFVDAWRHIARNPFPPEDSMRENRFAIHVECENPVLRKLTIENASDAMLDNFWLHREGAPNFYNVPTLIKSVTKPNQSDSEKVIALFSLFQTHYENFWPISPAGMLEDPPTLLASVGYGQCNLAAGAFELLCQSVGVETRRIGLELVENGETRLAHNAMEAYFDGGWHYFDPDGRVFYRLPDKTIASVAHFKKDASPIRSGPPPIGYRQELYADAFERGNTITYDPRHPLRRKTRYEDLNTFALMYRQAIRYDLPPGMKLVLSRDPAEKFFVQGLGAVRDKAEVDGIVPPCAGGQILWHISAASLQNSDVFHRTGKEAVVAIKSPYVIAGGEIAAETTDRTFHIGFLPFIFGPTYKHTFQKLSPDDGHTSVNFGAALPEFNPVTGFAFKITTRKELRSLQVTADIQHNPRALPRLVQGENRFVLWSPWPCTFTVENSPTSAVVETDKGVRFHFEFAEKNQP